MASSILKMREAFLKQGRQLELFYDVVSPYSFVAFEIIQRYVPLWNLQVVYRPFLLGGVFKAVGTVPNISIPNKKKLMMQDLQRMKDTFDLPLTVNKDGNRTLHTGSLKAMRLLSAISLQKPDALQPVSKQLYIRTWGKDLDISEDASLLQACEAAGLSQADAQSLLKAAGEDAAKQELKKVTDEAISRGAFGAPTIFIGDEIYFGSDRFEMMAQRLGLKWYGPSGNPYAREIQELLDGQAKL